MSNTLDPAFWWGFHSYENEYYEDEYEEDDYWSDEDGDMLYQNDLREYEGE